MADNFNLAKFLRNNQLLNEGIGGYKDIEPMKEDSMTSDGSQFSKGQKVKIKDEQEYGDDPNMGVSEPRFNDLKDEVLTVTGIFDDGETIYINDVDSLPASYLELAEGINEEDLEENSDEELPDNDGFEPTFYATLRNPNPDIDKLYTLVKNDPGILQQIIDFFKGQSTGQKMYKAGFRMHEDVDFNISQDEFFGRMMGLAHPEFEDVSPIVKKTIDNLREAGFDDQDIINFLATDFSLDEEVSVSSSGVQMEGEEFDWKPIDQQGKFPFKKLFVTITGDEMKVKGDDGFDSQSYTKDDIKKAMGKGEYLRFRGKNLQLNKNMKDWANS